MAYTMAAFLEDRITPEIRCLTAEADFRQIHIESVSVQEMPIDDFVRSDELVLSTAIRCIGNNENFMNFVKALYEAGAAGLLLAFEKRDTRVPDAVLAYASQVGFPIFQIPWKYRFSEIQTSVLEKISACKMQVYINLQTTLFNLYFDSQPLEKAAYLISEFLKVPVAVTNVAMKHLASVRLPAGKEDMLTALNIPITISNRPAGYLSLYPLPEVTLPDMELTQKYICFPLSLWFNRKTIEDMLIVRLKNDFVWDLANHNYTSFDEMVQQGRRLHFDLTRAYTCIALKAIPRIDQMLTAEYSNEMILLTDEMEQLLLATGRKLNRRLMYANRNLEFIIYYENKEEHSEAAVNLFLDTMDQELQKKYAMYEFHWGVSEISAERQPLDLLYQNATLALHYCVNAHSACYRFTYRDTKEMQLISILSNDPKAQKIAQDMIEVLRDDGRANGMNLIGTLTEYINCNYNISMTARNLHIHRQSLLYRLEKIETLTGLPLSDHRNVFLLELCIRTLSGYN